MKIIHKKILTPFAILLSFIPAQLVHAQHSGSASDSAKKITIGTIHTFYSNILKESREIWVSVPSDFHADMKGMKFPVALVLDGPDHFYSLTGMLDRFSRNPGNEVCPPMIVVGLVNTDRERDFNPDLNKDIFSGFLRDELLPYIDNHFPTQPFRILIGHSLAGLSTIHTALSNEELFKGYIAIDPSLGHRRNAWYESVRNKAESFYSEKSSIYIAMAQTMPAHMPRDTASIKKDTSGQSNHMRRIMEFSENLNRKNKETNDRFRWKYYPEESHQSLTQIAMYEGITYLFRWFKPTFYQTFFNTNVSPAEAAGMYEAYYKTVSQKLGYTCNPPADESGLTWYLFYKQQPQKALAIAELNLKYYPENKAQYQSVKWRTKKDVEPLLKTKTAKEVSKLCRKDFVKPEPEYNLSEDALNTLGYNLIKQKKTADALLIFLLNTELYPQSANVYDSYGECLLALNKTADAIVAYKKSIELNPANKNAQEVLKKITGQ